MRVLDTNTVIHYFKGLGRVAERLLATPPSQVRVPSLVVYELEVGIQKANEPQKRREQLRVLLASMAVLPFHVREAEVAAKVKMELEARGTPIGPMDVLIAGTALAHGATLITRNTREFERVDGLRVENWYD
ncbi:type II toxin-antitoxin system VapC family toxin [soil metagenome]|jgi:tRNA(fMet)-specific endonuclease VapC